MAANKPGAVHFSLIFFVMATIVAGVMAYMYYDDGRDLRAQIEAANKEKNDQKNAAQARFEEVNALKTKVGHEFEEVGVNASADPNDPNGAAAPPQSVLGAMEKDLQGAVSDLKAAEPNISQYVLATPPPSNYRTALLEYRKALMFSQDNFSKEQATTKSLNDQIATLRADYDKRATDAETARDLAVQARLKAEEEHKQALQAERSRYDNLNADYQKLNNEKLQEKNRYEQLISEKDERIAALENINNILQDRIKNATRTSFERADGIVRWVDNTSHLVWINLGSADNLAKRTNFSVYKKSNRGVGVDSENSLKGPEDLKGAIEVTRILGPHLAEARILDEDYYEPIAVDDPIYSPIWSANQKEAFALVGLIDFDDDGRSDRDFLHDVLASANATLQVEVDDQGNITGGEINERTKFLVVGKIPALDDLTNKEEIEAAKKINAAHKKLKDAAREQGVRVVTLNDFMAFIGVKPRQRVFRPGEPRPFALKNGSRSTATSESIGRNRVSSGNVSGVYSRSKRLRQPTGTGQTSGAYRGSR